MRTSKGKRKIEIKEIVNKAQKRVTFTKRRKGLFKKAEELCALTNAQAAIVTISGAGKVFSFGNPTADAVIHRYLNTHLNHDHSEEPDHHDDHNCSNRHWCDDPIGDDLGLVELEQLKVALEDLRNRVASKIVGELEQINRSNNFSLDWKSSSEYDLDLSAIDSKSSQDYDQDLGSIDWKRVSQAFGYAPMDDDVSPLVEQDAMLDQLKSSFLLLDN